MGLGEGRYSGQELNATSPLRRDTVLIPAYSWVVLRFVTDNREHPIPLLVYVMLLTWLLTHQFATYQKRVYGRSTATLRGIWRLGC
jgi:hypothetical protein